MRPLYRGRVGDLHGRARRLLCVPRRYRARVRHHRLVGTKGCMTLAVSSLVVNPRFHLRFGNADLIFGLFNELVSNPHLHLRFVA